MSLRHIRVRVTNWHEKAANPAHLAAAVMQWMPDCFRPVAVSGMWAGQLISRQSITWYGESEELHGLTAFSAGPMVFDPLPGEYRCCWDGALRHYAPGDREAAWYGRIQLRPSNRRPAQRVPLATVDLEGAGLPPAVSVTFPFGGYPVTSVLPSFDDDDIVERSGCTDTVERNCELLFPWIAKLPAALGWGQEIEWEINYADALYEDDAAALSEWEQRLREGAI